MSENNTISQAELEKLLAANANAKSAGDATTARAAAGVTPEAILERIDKIIADKTHIGDAVRILNGVTENSAGMGTLPHGMSVIVEARERTNREMIALLRDMYSDALGKKAEKYDDPDVMKLDKLAEVLAKTNLSSEKIASIIQTATQQMFAKPATGDIHNY